MQGGEISRIRKVLPNRRMSPTWSSKSCHRKRSTNTQHRIAIRCRKGINWSLMIACRLMTMLTPTNYATEQNRPTDSMEWTWCFLATGRTHLLFEQTAICFTLRPTRLISEKRVRIKCKRSWARSTTLSISSTITWARLRNYDLSKTLKSTRRPRTRGDSLSRCSPSRTKR